MSAFLVELKNNDSCFLFSCFLILFWPCALSEENICISHFVGIQKIIFAWRISKIKTMQKYKWARHAKGQKDLSDDIFQFICFPCWREKLCLFVTDAIHNNKMQQKRKKEKKKEKEFTHLGQCRYFGEKKPHKPETITIKKIKEKQNKTIKNKL